MRFNIWAKYSLKLIHLAVVPFLLFSTAQATVVRFMPFEEQVSTAEIIVLAVAGQQVASWDSDKQFIHTETTFQIEEAVKGTASGTVTLRQLGGEVDGIGQSVAGTPKIVPGKKYVLFLEPDPAGGFRVVGFNQGYYPVAGDTKQKAVVTTRTALAGKQLLTGEDDFQVGSMGLQEFLSRIRTQLERDN